MHAQTTIDQIHELLAENLSQRAIARELGVSRMLVGKVAAGTWRPRKRRAKRPRKRRAKPAPTPKPRLLKFQSIPPTRCGRCGVLVVTTPCIACYLRLIGATRPSPDLDE